MKWNLLTLLAIAAAGWLLVTINVPRQASVVAARIEYTIDALANEIELPPDEIAAEVRSLSWRRENPIWWSAQLCLSLIPVLLFTLHRMWQGRASKKPPPPPPPHQRRAGDSTMLWNLLSLAAVLAGWLWLTLGLHSFNAALALFRADVLAASLAPKLGVPSPDIAAAAGKVLIDSFRQIRQTAQSWPVWIVAGAILARMALERRPEPPSSQLPHTQ